MGSARDTFPHLLDALRGHSDVPAGADPATLREAERLLERGGAVAADAPVPRAWIRRARRLIRSKPRLFALVFDSWFEPRPALRGAATASEPRFLRFEGPVTVDLEVTAGERTATLLGQLDPPDAHAVVRLHCGDRTRKAKIGPDGTFRFGAVPRGSATLELDRLRLEDVPI